MMSVKFTSILLHGIKSIGKYVDITVIRLQQGGISLINSRSAHARLLACFVIILSIMAAMPEALAQDVFVIQADALDMNRLGEMDYVNTYLSAGTQYIRVQYALEDEQQVSLLVTQTETGSIVLDKNYGLVSGTFDSGDIYIKFSDSGTVAYTIHLKIGETTHTFPFYRKLMVLRNNTASTFGLRIHQLDKSLTDSWTMATPLDLEEIAALPDGIKRIDICASNMYIIGTATVRIRDGMLRVSLQLNEEKEFEIEEQHLFLITSPATWYTADPRQLDHNKYDIGIDIPLVQALPGIRYAVLYLPMRLSYDPNGLDRFSYNPEDTELLRQLEIWDAMKELEKTDSVG